MVVMLVDSDKSNLTQLEDSIRTVYDSVDVVSFTDPEESLRYATRHLVHMVCAEVRMKNLTGLELARKLKCLDDNMRVILMQQNVEYALDAWRVHADYFLQKPVQREELEYYRKISVRRR